MPARRPRKLGGAKIMEKYNDNRNALCTLYTSPFWADF
jgi:hypothetical protein